MKAKSKSFQKVRHPRQLNVKFFGNNKNDLIVRKTSAYPKVSKKSKAKMKSFALNRKAYYTKLKQAKNDMILNTEDSVEVEVPVEYSFQNSEFNEPLNKDIYSNYQPSKLKIGNPHSFTVVESRSLVSVESPDITYQLSLPSKIITNGLLSNVQLESVVYACQKHETFLPDSIIRSGFLIGDGAGVGKGRTIAGIIYENIIAGRNRSIWISVSNDLIEDARRDFRDIGADVKVVLLSRLTYKENTCMHSNTNEVLFATYASLIGKTKKKETNSFTTRFDQIINWFGENYDGVIVFDECHRAKNLATESYKCKTAFNVKLLQEKLPYARIVYSSATGASVPAHMAYMIRLGLWGPSQICLDFFDFERKLKRHGVSSMELIAMDMKRKGLYIARQLSFKDIKFDIIEVKMADEILNGYIFKAVYNKCVEIWTNLRNEFQIAYVNINASKKDVMYYERIYWGAHQRFFKYLCISGKVSSCVRLAKKDIDDGKCVVIGLQSTGEARIDDVLANNNGELTDFVSSAKEILKSLISKHFPTREKILKMNKPRKKNCDKTSDEDCNGYRKITFDDEEDIQQGLLKYIKEVDTIFPMNTLDQLIMELGGPDNVAEMTGRKGRIVLRENGNVEYEPRRNIDVNLDQMNIDEKIKFNNGEKLIAVISDAASTGISLHSDLRFGNKRQRVHMTLELPWSADKAIQQFGRTHRSNQTVPPHYKFLISDMAGERRFAATVAKRLESLGALTHGDRKAEDSKDLSQFNFEHEIGYKAVNQMIRVLFGPLNYAKSLPGAECFVRYVLPAFRSKAKQALIAVGIEGDGDCSVAKFLNRLLGIEVDMQNELFQYFMDVVEYMLKEAKFNQQFDHGIRDVTSDLIECEKVNHFSNDLIDGGSTITISKIKYVNDGLAWSTVLEKHYDSPWTNYFCVLKGHLSYDLVALIVDDNERSYRLVTPVFPDEIVEKRNLKKQWCNVSLAEAEVAWNKLLIESENQCIHLLMEGRCMKKFCTYGKRTKFNYMITGAIFLARSIIDESGLIVRIDVARLKLNGNEKIIGAFFNPNHYDRVMSILSERYCDPVVTSN